MAKQFINEIKRFQKLAGIIKEANEETEEPAAEAPEPPVSSIDGGPTLKVDVNHNETKKGIKIQFAFPQNLNDNPDEKAEMAQKLQKKLTDGLGQYNLTVSQDTDVPYANVIGFLIPLADFRLMIKNAIEGGGEAAPAPEEPAA